MKHPAPLRGVEEVETASSDASLDPVEGAPRCDFPPPEVEELVQVGSRGGGAGGSNGEEEASVT